MPRTDSNLPGREKQRAYLKRFSSAYRKKYIYISSTTLEGEGCKRWSRGFAYTPKRSIASLFLYPCTDKGRTINVVMT